MQSSWLAQYDKQGLASIEPAYTDNDHYVRSNDRCVQIADDLVAAAGHVLIKRGPVDLAVSNFVDWGRYSMAQLASCIVVLRSDGSSFVRSSRHCGGAAYDPAQPTSEEA